MKRLLRITSHVGLSRFLATVDGEFCGWIARTDIPSPYASGPTHGVYNDPKRGKVIVVETAHKRFDVFAIGDEPIFATDDQATTAFIAKGTR